jgi:phosphoenolpyruvate carboxykinase (GTP)
MAAGTDASKLPKIYYVNWFRKDEDGSFLWPGYGENSRVLEWICRRCNGDAGAVETPIGNIPQADDLNTTGLDVPQEDLEAILRFEAQQWSDEIPAIREHLAKFGDRLPGALQAELDKLASQL